MAGPIRISILANSSGAVTEINRTSSAMSGIGRAGAAMARGVAIGIGAAAVGITAFAIKGVKAASDLNETINKSNIIFGKNAAVIEKWAGGAADSMGLSKQAALESAAGFGDMFTQIGFTGDAAAKLSQKTVQMAADFGSFNNLPTADVAERISAAYRGEYDSLQALIPNINAARVEQEAMTRTGKDSAKELTAREKALAVNAILTRDGARATGDFARTSDGLANSQKKLAAKFEDIKAKIGAFLLPAFEDVVNHIDTKILPAVERFIKVADKEGFGAALDGLVAEITKWIDSVDWAAKGEAAGKQFGDFLKGMFGAAGQDPTVAEALGQAVGHLIGAAFTSAVVGLRTALNSWSDAIYEWIGGQLTAGLQSVGAKFQWLWNWLKTQAVDGIKSVGDKFQLLWEKAKQVWEAIKVAAQHAWDSIKTYIAERIAAVKLLLDGVRERASAIWASIKLSAQNAWEAVRGYVSEKLAAARTYLDGLRDRAGAIWTSIRTAASNAWEAIKDAIGDKINAAKEKVTAALVAIRTKITGFNLYQAGANLIQGLIDGIGAKIELAVQRVQNGLDRIKRLLPGSPILDGPLRSWNNGGAGKRLMDLLISGVQSRVPAFNNALDGVNASPSLALSATTAGTAPAAGGTLTVNVGGSGSDADAGRQIVQQIAAWTALNGPVRIALAS